MNEIAEKFDSLERTVLEIDAMVSIFCHDFTDESQADDEEFVITTPEALECARTSISIDHPPEAFDMKIPQINVEAFVRSMSENCDDGARLRISLPPGYPSASYAEVTVLSIPKKFPRSQLDELSTKLQCQAKGLLGSEVIMEIINECRDTMEDWEKNKLCHQISDEVCTDNNVNSSTESISRRWIWVHHITNAGRLKQIVTEAQDLKLGGFLKGGYPGVVVVEGRYQSCEEFVGWIKGNKSRPGGFGRNWGHHVRGEVTVDKRQLTGAFEELEDDMGKFGNLCKEHDVEDEFRDFILQHK
mmetsp:Transcript_5540/g.12623  ORF Transcript_5540/g.12623 Transcript_5540/m.12623 type:complete len:301 (+) Transcript_5540:63-965(+)